MGFRLFEMRTGLLASIEEAEHPSRLFAWQGETLSLPDGATYFGYVQSGKTRIRTGGDSFPLRPGMYFSAPSAATIEGEGQGVVMARLGYAGFFQIGGPIEARGRLCYIDGCTDSLLLSPVMLGDPCLNLLHFPPGIRQTAHTHPSARLGMVTRGEGRCLLERETVPLLPGSVFIIEAGTVHGFSTEERDMTVIAYHPDSDFGPTHRDHPMINRTLVEGVSAKYLDQIQTNG